MPKILPTFAAIAIIGVCIAFNTIRYPIVWEMTGPGTQSPLSENFAPAAENAWPAKAISSATASQTPAPSADVPPAIVITAEKTISPPNPTEFPLERQALSQAIPISLPPAEVASADASKAAEKTENAAKAENINPQEGDNFVRPPARLVPVAADRSAVISQGMNFSEVRRLPPVEVEVAQPADRYASEYPPTAIPIYPSTGK